MYLVSRALSSRAWPELFASLLPSPETPSHLHLLGLPTTTHTPHYQMSGHLPQRPSLPTHTHPCTLTLSHTPNTQIPTLGTVTKEHIISRSGMHSQALTHHSGSLEDYGNLINSVNCLTRDRLFQNLSLETQARWPLLPSDSSQGPSPWKVRAQGSEEHTHCKSDLAVLFSQVAQVSWDVGLQPQVLSADGILLEGKDPPDFTFLLGIKEGDCKCR